MYPSLTVDEVVGGSLNPTICTYREPIAHVNIIKGDVRRVMRTCRVYQLPSSLYTYTPSSCAAFKQLSKNAESFLILIFSLSYDFEILKSENPCTERIGISSGAGWGPYSLCLSFYWG